MLTRTLLPSPRFVIVPLLAVAAGGGIHLSEARGPSWPGSMDGWLARYPSREANAAALEVESLSASLGIDIASRSFEGRDRPSPESAKEHTEVKRELHGYLDGQLELADSGIDAPPERVGEFLARREEGLAALRRQLIEGATPRWELQVEKLYGSPVPNLLGHLELGRLLCADALARAQRGDRDGALADLEASWRLGEALRDDPILITQLISISIARMQIGVLRHMENVPAVWRQRLAAADFREPILTALAFESFMWTRVDEQSLITVANSPLYRILYSMVRPYVWLCAYEASGNFGRKLANLSRLDYVCDRDLEAEGAALDVELPWWNLVAEIFVPNLGIVPKRLARIELDIELTRKILEIKAARDAHGAWPIEVPRISESEACPEDRWDYEVTDDGERSISFARQLEWPDQHGLLLPTRYTFPAR